MKIIWLVVLLTYPVAAAEAKLYLQLGHSDWVRSVAFSPDGRLALTGSKDKTARLWDAETGQELRKFEGHSEDVYSVAFSPDGRFVLTGSPDRTARLWDAATGREIRRFEGQSVPVFSVAFSPDGRFLLLGGWGTQLLDAKTGQELRRFEAKSRDLIYSVAFSPDGRLVLTGGDAARVWEADTGKELRRFEGDAGLIYSVAFSPDGRFVLTASGRAARLWDLTTGQELRSFKGHSSVVHSASFSPDGRFVITGSWDKTARLWDAATGQELRKFEGHSELIESAAFSPDGRSVLTGSADNTARIWEAETGRKLSTLVGHSHPVTSVAFSPNRRFVISENGNKAVLWDAGTGQELRRFETPVRSAVFSTDGRFVLTGGEDKTARLWDVVTGLEIRRFVGHSGPILSVACSPDGRFVLTGSADNTARRWDAATGLELRKFEGHSSWVESVTFSPNGRYALTGSLDGTVRLWDAWKGLELRQFDGHSGSVTSVAFSADGRFLLAGSLDNKVRLWSAATGRELQEFEGHSAWIDSVSFSPDDRFVLTGSADNTARLWDAATGLELHRFTGHSDLVFSVAFSPDGRLVLTGSRDGTARLWDPNTGRLLATMVSVLEGGWDVVDPDGRYDASDPDNSPSLKFVVANDVVELGQLKQRFYTPGLLGRIWQGEKLDPLPGSLKDVKLVPGVQVQAPSAGSTVAAVKLTNRSGGIGRVTVKVNGREMPSVALGAVPDAGAKTAELKFDLSAATLAPNGKNVIEVFAENGDGLIRSRGVVVPWERAAPKETPAPRLFAIIAGTAGYDNPAMNLQYPAKDAMDFAHAIELASEGLFGKDGTRITLLATGSANEPSKENIRRAFEAVAKSAQASDLLVVYFAGHGAAGGGERDQYYYFTREARSIEVQRDVGLRALSTISSSELKSWLSRRNMPLKQVVVLDTCAAGAAFGDVVKLAAKRDLSPDQIRAIELLKDSTGSWILMGSAADSVSYEATRYAQGLLTYALLEGMQGRALDEGDRVEVGRLFSFAQKQVADLAKGIGGIQQPVLSAPKGQTFPIGLLKEDARKQIHLATVKPQLLRARVLDGNDLDSLKLEPVLRAGLRAASLPVAVGALHREEPPIVYLDSVVDEVPDALIPQVRYEMTGDRVKVRLRLLRNGSVAVERNAEFRGDAAEEIGKELVRLLVGDSLGIQ